MLKRIILVLTITTMMLATIVAGSGLPALAQDAPADPYCGWYYMTDAEYDPWWEYWCWWPGWGWEFVFWVWADVPDEDPAPPEDEAWPWALLDWLRSFEDEDVPPEDEDSPPEEESWPWPFTDEGSPPEEEA